MRHIIRQDIDDMFFLALYRSPKTAVHLVSNVIAGLSEGGIGVCAQSPRRRSTLGRGRLGKPRTWRLYGNSVNPFVCS